MRLAKQCKDMRVPYRGIREACVAGSRQTLFTRSRVYDERSAELVYVDYVDNMMVISTNRGAAVRAITSFVSVTRVGSVTCEADEMS
jgi:hypothetical protein